MTTPSFLTMTGKERRRHAKRQRRALLALGQAPTMAAAAPPALRINPLTLTDKDKRRVQRGLRPLTKLLRRQQRAFRLMTAEWEAWGQVSRVHIPGALRTLRRALERSGGNATAIAALDSVTRQLQEGGNRREEFRR
jgi:hypothetical protein